MRTGLLALLVLALSFAGPARGSQPGIDHVFVFYLENWSFDGLYGLFPGVDGIANLGEVVQRDEHGVRYETLPQVDRRIPAGLPVKPFDLEPYIPSTELTGDPAHHWSIEQTQIDGGTMEKFVAYSGVGALAMSYYDARKFPVGELAARYTICDRFFHSAFGDSFHNHTWLVAARSMVWPDPPAEQVRLDNVTEDGFIVSQPTDQTAVPLQTLPTIGDRMSDAGVSWAWYGMYDTMILGYFENYQAGRPGNDHLKPIDLFLEDLHAGRLPQVSFVIPVGHSEHPEDTAFLPSERYTAALLQAIMASPVWERSLVILTYDEHGGRWDHVPPPIRDRFGPGTRVPGLILSPFAKVAFVDHAEYETLSVLKCLEELHGLEPLQETDRGARNFDAAMKDPAVLRPRR